MRTAKIVRVPQWRIVLNNCIFSLFIQFSVDIKKISKGNPKLLVVALLLYCAVFLLSGFAWAIINYRLGV